MRHYKLTLIGFAVAVTLWSLTVSLNLDLFENFMFCLQRHEAFEMDELIFPAAIFYIFLMMNLVQRYHNHKLEIERLRVYRSMMKAMNHILNNFLQKMLLFKLTADETAGFNPEVLEQYDKIIDEATAQINALNCLTNPDEDNILETIGHPDFGEPNSSL